jgi:hypothetical protein
MLTPLYVHIKKGTALKLGSLVGLHAARTDHFMLPNGDADGRVLAANSRARKILEAEPGITVLPPLHRPITDVHAAAFAHINAKAGELGYDLAERLRDTHGLPWFDPEEPFL